MPSYCAACLCGDMFRLTYRTRACNRQMDGHTDRRKAITYIGVTWFKLN